MLTENDKIILKALFETKNNFETAKILNIDITDAKKEINKLYEKLGVKNRIQAIIIYLKSNN